jgi:hypothetical protein
MLKSFRGAPQVRPDASAKYLTVGIFFLKNSPDFVLFSLSNWFNALL